MAKQKESDVDYLSPEWHEYAMSHFQENEIIDGHPNVAGLRRVAELLLGPVLNSEVVQAFPVMDSKEPGRATVVYKVTIQFKDGTLRTFSDVADVWHGNTDDMFLVHAVATACTKAESRCLRKMLKIRGIAAEEMMVKDPSKIISEVNKSAGISERCNKDQVNFINVKCKKLDINAMNFINSGKKSYRSVWEIEKDVAAKMITKIGLMLKGECEFDREALGTYVENWEN